MTDLFNSGIRPVVDAHIAKLAEEERNYGNYWSASSAGYCMRLLILRRLKLPAIPEIEDARVRNQRVFSAGHVFHEWIQRITKESGLSIAQELELQDEDLMIRGHIDDLILIPGYDPAPYGMPEDAPSSWSMPEVVPDKLILYDYKTVHSAYFNYKKDKVSHYHKYQLASYMMMLRKLAKKELERRQNESKSK